MALASSGRDPGPLEFRSQFSPLPRKSYQRWNVDAAARVSSRASMLLSRGPLRRGTAALQRCASLARFYSTPIQNDAQQKPAVSIVFGQEPPSSLPDPFAVVASQLRPLETSLKDLVGSDHPVLTRVAQHFFELVGKRFRPTIVLLAASAAAGGEPANARQVRPTQHPSPQEGAARR